MKCGTMCYQQCRARASGGLDRRRHRNFQRRASIRSESRVNTAVRWVSRRTARVAVSLSVATWSSSLPIAYRLYLPKEWAEDSERRETTEVLKEVEFQTKPDIALDQLRAAVAASLDRGVVLADAAYGINTEFRDGVSELDLQ